MGSLFCFFELSSALTACSWGVDPFEQTPTATTAFAMETREAEANS
jgi:hypothetical protein